MNSPVTGKSAVKCLSADLRNESLVLAWILSELTRWSVLLGRAAGNHQVTAHSDRCDHQPVRARQTPRQHGQGLQREKGLSRSLRHVVAVFSTFDDQICSEHSTVSSLQPVESTILSEIQAQFNKKHDDTTPTTFIVGFIRFNFFPLLWYHNVFRWIRLHLVAESLGHQLDNLCFS